MWQLAIAFAEVAVRRRGPEGIPDSGFLLVLTVIVDFAVYLVQLGFAGGVTSLRLLEYLAEVLLLFAFVYAVLVFFKLERRFRQTTTAIIGAGIIISLCVLPVVAAAALTGNDPLAEPFVIVLFAAWFWAIYITATVLARALSQPLIVGLGFAILYICLSTFLSLHLAADVNGLDTGSG